MKKNYFKYVVLGVVLLIPFIYSFFYLKAYWDPYGKGNMDNLPVAIVNLDKKDKGKELANEIINSKSLKASLTNENKANEGLNNKTYYAVITIPSDFTESMESISTNDQKHPTITYSPNQKSNYLASQIIDRVVLTVEANLNNKINSEIVGTLSDNLDNVPNQLETISNGFSTMNNGISFLNSGSKKLVNGGNALYTNYKEYNAGIKKIQSSSKLLADSQQEFNQGINTLASSKDSLNTLKNSINQLASGSNTLNLKYNEFDEGLNSYVNGVNQSLDITNGFSDYIIALYNNPNIPTELKPDNSLYQYAQALKNGQIDTLKGTGNILKNSSSTIKSSITTINGGLSQLNQSSSKIDELTTGINKLQEASSKLTDGSKALNEGINTLSGFSDQIQNGINSIKNGNESLNNGIETLNNKVSQSKNTLDNKIANTKDELKKVNNLKEYSKEPVKVNKKIVNKVDSYGTAFSPLFASIGLWIGSLMLYIVLFFDRAKRYPKLDQDSNNLVKRTMYYHGLASIAGIILGILLSLFLDLHITNYLLYLFIMFISANTFTAIINFLIVNFKDIGKFIALIILVLQLAASAGTFPIETVTKGFRWLNHLLPMTYTINLFKESLVTIESSLLSKNLIIVISIFLIFFITNIVLDIYKQKKLTK